MTILFKYVKKFEVVDLYIKTAIEKVRFVEGRLDISFADRTGVSICPAVEDDEKVFAPGTVVIIQIENMPSQVVVGMIKVESSGHFGKALVQGGEYRQYWRAPPKK